MQTETVMMPRELTAENGAKGLLSGEFFIEHKEICRECADLGEYGNEGCFYCNGTNEVAVKVPVSWTTIKAIYAKAVEALGQ